MSVNIISFVPVYVGGEPTTGAISITGPVISSPSTVSGDPTSVLITSSVPTYAGGEITLGDIAIIAPNTTNTLGGNAFTSIAVPGENTVVPDSISDTLTLVAGNNITITTDDITDTITIEAAGGVIPNSFETLAAAGNTTGDANIVADITADTAIIAGGTAISIDFNATTDTITFNFSDDGLANTAVVGTDTLPFFDAGTPALRSFSDIFLDLDVPNGISSNGLITRTAADTYASRSITVNGTGALDGLVITNGDGVSGNPTLGLDIQNLPVRSDAVDNTDRIAVYNITSGANEYYTVAELAGAAGASDSFNTWAAGGNTTGDVSVIADSPADTVTIIGGNAISIDFNGTIDAITFNFTNDSLVDTAVTGADTVVFFDATNADNPAIRSFSNVFADLDIPNGISANGLITRIAADTYASRSIAVNGAGTLDGLAISDGDGVSGDPTIGLDIQNLPVVSDALDGTDRIPVYNITANANEYYTITQLISFSPVTSVFARTGNVVAQANDYDANQIDFTPSGGIIATDVQAAIVELDNEKAAVVHTHDTGDIVSGTFADARISQSSVTQHQAAIDHNALLNSHNLTTDIDHDQLTNFVANEHIDHSTININTGDGLSGGGDIIVSRTIDLDFSTPLTVTAAPGDLVLISDASDAGNVKTVNLNDLIDGTEFADNVFRIQDNLDATKELAFEVSGIATATTRTITVPNTNIDLTPGSGSFAAASHTHAAADIISGTFANARIAQSNVTQHEGAIDHNALLNTHNLTTDIDHDQLTNFVINEHVDHSAVNINTGNGLSGGGNITFTRTINLDFSTPATVTAASGDLVLISDASDLGNVKTVDLNDLIAGASSNSFETWLASGNTTGNASIVADSDTDTATIAGGTAISIDFNSTTDTITFNFSDDGLANSAVVGTDTLPFFDAGTPARRSFNNVFADLDVPSGISATGLITRTGLDAYASRSIIVDGVGALDGLAVSNGDGVSGNPTIGLDIQNLPVRSDAVDNSDRLAVYNITSGANEYYTVAELAGAAGASDSFNTWSASGNTTGDANIVADSSADTVTIAGGNAITIDFNATTDVITFNVSEASIDHTAIANVGTNTHAQIDSHIADGTIHFTEASIDHTAIANIGTNSHAQIDSHIADASIHFTEASITFPTEFSDLEFRIQDNLDATKELSFEVSGITTATTRTITVPDSNLDLTPGSGSFAAASHTHAAADIISGTFANARISQSSVTQHQAAINHDQLTNFVANEHIDHSAVNINTGDGLSGGGNITVSRTIDLDFSTPLTVTAASSDLVLISDASDAGNVKTVDLNDLIGGGGTEFSDSVFRIQDNLDATKELAFEVSGITTATTRTITVPDSNLDLTPGSGSFAAASHTHAAGDVISGTFANARIAQSNVTQHEAALTITESQISDLSHTVITVEEDDITVASPVTTLNFEGDVAVADNTGGKVTITVTGTGGGESNTASNQGLGIGVFDEKNGVDLEFRSLVSANNLLTISLDDPNDEIDFTINQGNIDHTAIANVGTNTHAQIDTHIADATIHFTEGSIDHTAISNIGTNTHAQIDTHIADGTIHFTEASIDHTAISNIGTNTHAQIDSHIADASIHFTEASITFPTEFSDLEFRIQDNVDATKELAFEVSGITTATTRTITVPDSNIDLTPGTGSFAAASHTHAAADIISGTFADARISQSSVTQHQAAIDHDALLNTHNLTTDIDHDQLTNFVANEHIDHSTVSINTGDGLSGGGDITASRTIDLDFSTPTTVTAASGDLVLISDASDAGNVKTVDLVDLIGGASNSFETWLAAGNTTGDVSIVADSDTDTATIAGGDAISVDFDAGTDTITFNLTNDSLTAVTAITGADTIIFFDVTSADDPAIRSFTDVFADLDVPNGITVNGLITRTAADTYASRSIVVNGAGALDGLAISDGDGVSGNPTIGLDIQNLPALSDGFDGSDLVPVFNVSTGANEYYLLSDVSTGASNSFETWLAGGNTTGDVSIVADSDTDTATLVGGTAISIDFVSATDTITINFSNDGLADTAVVGADTFPFFDSGSPVSRSFTKMFSDLGVPNGISSNGIITRTAANTYTSRTITASANEDELGIAITNGDGVSGNPTVGLDIVSLTDAAADMAATDEFVLHDKSEGTAGANRKITGQNIADGVQTILSLDAFANGIEYNFDTTVTDADPGSGNLRFNNATVSSVTEIYIDDENADAVDVQAWIATLDDSTNTSKGVLHLAKKTNQAQFAVFEVTAITENTGYWTITVNHIVNSFTPAVDPIMLLFSRAGDVGPANKSFTWVLADPAVGVVIGPRLDENYTVQRVDAYHVGGTSVEFNVEERADPSAAGTNVMSAELTTTTTGASDTGAFNNDSLASGNFLVLDISAVTGGVTQVSITVDV